MNTKNEGCNAIFIGKAFVLVRQLKDKTIICSKDKVARARQMQIALQAQDKAERQSTRRARQSTFGRTIGIVCRNHSARQSRIVLEASFGQTIQDCLGSHRHCLEGNLSRSDNA